MNQRIRKEQSHTRFYWLLTFLLSLIFARYALQIDIPRIVFLVIIAVIALLGNQTEILAICMCLIPLHESVDFYYSIVICMAVYVLKNYRRIRINQGFFLVLVMIVWELLHCFDVSFSIVTFVTTITPLMMLAVILCTDVAELDYDFIVRALAFTVAATGITLLGRVLYLANFNLTAAFAGLRRLGMTDESTNNGSVLTGGAIHPNSLGIICVLAATGLLQLRTAGRKRKPDMPLIIILLVIGSLTSSRTFLVCLVLMAVLMIMAQPGDVTKKIRFLISLLLFAAAALLLLSYLFPDLLEYYVNRFFVDDITTGRMDLIEIYNRFIVEKPYVMFFGIGLQSFGEKVTTIYRLASTVPHNSIQEIIIAWGIPGLVLFILLLVMMIRQSRKYGKRQTLLNYIPLMILLVKSLAGQLLTSGYSMLALSYAYLSLTQNFKEDMRHDPQVYFTGSPNLESPQSPGRSVQ